MACTIVFFLVAMATCFLLMASATTHTGSTTTATTTASSPAKPLRILCLMTVDTMSHHIWMSALTVELARRGHRVTSIDVAVPKDVPPTLNVTVMDNAFQTFGKNVLKFTKAGNRVQQQNLLHLIQVDECERDLATPALQRLIAPSFAESFDLIILDYLDCCMLGFAHRFGYPGVVALSPFPGAQWIDNLMGNPTLPTIVPNPVLHYPLPMTLWQRAVSAFLQASFRFLSWQWSPVKDLTMRKYFGEDVPALAELKKSVHLAFVNENPVLDVSRSMPPNVIPVGGMHVKPSNLSSISWDLRRWMDEAKEGFILVSFGSIMTGASLDAAKKQALMDAFGALGGVRVLWKIEPEFMDAASLAPNVRLQKWLPQNDILGHPKLRLFVSHCGGLSTQEASYHGVPVLGVPLIVDQFVNLEKIVNLGMGRRMPYAELSKDRLVTEIRTMLADPKYRDAARRTGEMIRDQKETPLERAVWWAEYVGRHRGAPHLRSPALDLAWYQVMMVDIIGLLVLAVLALLVVVFLVLKLVLRAVRGVLRRLAPQQKATKKD